MSTRSFALVTVLVFVSALSIVAQERSAGAVQGYRVPRTADGQPDLQGYWTNLTYTPLERPRALASKPFYTEQEAIEAFNKAIADTQDQIVHYVNSDFGATPVQTGAQPNRRTSLIIDPLDGRLPPLTPNAEKREAARQAAEKASGRSPRTGETIAVLSGASSMTAPCRRSWRRTAATTTSCSRAIGSC